MDELLMWLTGRFTLWLAPDSHIPFPPDPR